MIEKRKHKRARVEFWASLRHPKLGTITCDIEDMSISGLSVKLDEEVDFSVMMELDVKIHGSGWDGTMPPLPVRVIRVNKRKVALQFIDDCAELWTPPDDDEFDFKEDEINLSIGLEELA